MFIEPAVEALQIQGIRTVPLNLVESRVMPNNWSLLTQRATFERAPFVAQAADLAAFGWRFGLRLRQLFASLAAWQPPATPSVHALRTKASLFAYNAPDPRSLTGQVAVNYELAVDPNATPPDWRPPFDRRAPALDASYPRIAAGTVDAPSYAALKWSNAQGEHWLVAQVAAAADVGLAQCTVSGRVTQLQLGPLNDRGQLEPLNESDASARTTAFANFSEYRGASLQAESEALTLARLPRSDEPLPATSVIDLDTWIDGLYAGQHLIVTGELDQSRGTYASEVVQIQSVDQVIAAGGYTSLTLSSALTQAFVRETVTINGNVAAATHGSAVQEALGSGDTTQASQRFMLRQSPLTYVSAATASGVASTLALRVNGVLWAEVPNFYGAKPDDRVYTTRLNDDGTTTVSFGDGTNGARPSSGSENIAVAYRKGLGAVGNVGASQLTLLQTRPLGVQSVSNPIAASGGSDAESAADIRGNAALTLRTLDRIVSLQDYEDFARAFGGIAKSLASWTWHGQARGVFLTVAGIAGADIPAGSPISDHLLGAIAAAAEPNVPVRLASYRRASFTFGATLFIDPARDQAAVLAAAEQAARTAYAFDSRAFGQPVTRSEIIALLQSVAGVVAVQVSALRRTDTALFTSALQTGALRTSALRLLPLLRENSQIDAALPQLGEDNTVLAAELLTLDPRPLNLVALWAEARP